MTIFSDGGFTDILAENIGLDKDDVDDFLGCIYGLGSVNIFCDEEEETVSVISKKTKSLVFQIYLSPPGVYVGDCMSVNVKNIFLTHAETLRDMIENRDMIFMGLSEEL